MALFLVFILAASLGGFTLAAYGTLRASRATRKDVVSGVRLHGFATALGALFFSCVTGPQRIGTYTETGNEGVPDAWAGGWMTAPVHLAHSWQLWFGALLAPALVALVYVAAQRTFPAPRGEIRRASLTPRETGRLLPAGLLALTALVVGLIGLALVLVMREPSTPRIIPPLQGGGTEPDRLAAYQAHAAGAEIVPWIALAVAATIAAMAVALGAITRRRVVEGLSPAEDHAARVVAANRLLRTGVWSLWLPLMSAWTSFTDSRAARDVLAEYVPGHPAALPLEPSLDWISAVDVVGIIATPLLVTLLLLWRSPALSVLRPAHLEGTTAETAAGARA